MHDGDEGNPPTYKPFKMMNKTAILAELTPIDEGGIPFLRALNKHTRRGFGNE